MCTSIHQGCCVVEVADGLRLASGVDGVDSRCPSSDLHFFFMAFSAALVCLPSRTLGVVALMTPTATVCLMSRTANLRRKIERRPMTTERQLTFQEEGSR